MPPTFPSTRAFDSAHARRARLTGIALMCGAVGCFAFLDASAKYLGRHMDVLEVVWARYTFGFLLALLWSNPLRQPGMLRSARPGLQIARSALLLGSTTLNFFAIKYLQLDQALAITFSTPFLVAALSGPVLGEWVGPRRWAAIGVGFLGVLVVTRPGFDAIHPAALLSAAGALCYAVYALDDPYPVAQRLRTRRRCSIPTWSAPSSCCRSPPPSGRRRTACSSAH